MFSCRDHYSCPCCHLFLVLSQIQELHTYTSACAGLSCDPYWTCEDCLYWTTNTEPIDNLLNKHHGKKDILGSMQQWSTSPRLIQTACSIRPQTCTFHSMSCTWPNCSTPVYVKQLQRRKQRLVLLVDSQRWFLHPLFFLISEALSGSSTVPQRVLMLTAMKD